MACGTEDAVVNTVDLMEAGRPLADAIYGDLGLNRKEALMAAVLLGHALDVVTRYEKLAAWVVTLGDDECVEVPELRRWLERGS